MSAGSAMTTHCWKKIWTRDGSCGRDRRACKAPSGPGRAGGALGGAAALTTPVLCPQAENRSHVLGRRCTALKRANVWPSRGSPRELGAVSMCRRHQRMRRYFASLCRKMGLSRGHRTLALSFACASQFCVILPTVGQVRWEQHFEQQVMLETVRTSEGRREPRRRQCQRRSRACRR